MMRSILFGFLIIGFGACQTSSQRKIASEDQLQVRVLPKGTKIKLGRHINFDTGSTFKQIVSTTSSGSATKCMFNVVRPLKSTEKLRLSKGNEYYIDQTSVSPTYSDFEGSDVATVTNAKAVRTSYKLVKAGLDPSSVSIEMTCVDCLLDSDLKIVNTSCINAHPSLIEVFFKNLQHQITIGEGPSVINVPKQATIVPIKYDDSAKDIANPAAI